MSSRSSPRRRKSYLEEREEILQGVTMLQIRRGKRDNLGIICNISPVKHMLRPIMRIVSPRRI